MELLPIKIDFQNKTPLSEQISERIRLLIRADVLKSGEPLPTVRQLAFQLGVNFNTVARAYRALDAEGLIVTWQGRGTFVEEGQSPLQQAAQKPSAQTLVEALFDQAHLLNFPEVEVWAVLDQRREPAQETRIETIKKTQKKTGLLVRRRKPMLPTAQGITLRRTRSTVYKRKPRMTGKKQDNVSRGTN